MKLIIFGAAGGTGRKFVEQALEQKHLVTAFARNPARLDDIKNSNLQIVQGDVMDFTSVERLCRLIILLLFITRPIRR